LKLGCSHDLVTNQDIRDTAVDHGLCLTDLLATDAHWTMGHLVQTNDRTLVRLGMWTEADRLIRYRRSETLKITLERIKGEQKSWSVHGIQRHADVSRGASNHNQVSSIETGKGKGVLQKRVKRSVSKVKRQAQRSNKLSLLCPSPDITNSKTIGEWVIGIYNILGNLSNPSLTTEGRDHG
jgi:hypothetical protein